MKHDDLIKGLNRLRLFSMTDNYSEYARTAEKKRQTYEQYLAELVSVELESKQTQRIQRLIKQSRLPLDKELSHYQYEDREGISAPEIQRLATGDFLKEAVNVVFYGDFGVGKTHLAIGLVKELCRQGYKCIYFTVSGLVEELIREKQELKINQFYKKLDRYDLIFCDELGYVPQTTEGANLFFQLISQRAERKSMMITTNLPFSQWAKVFLDEMTTQAAVDRIIHRCETFHIKGPSFRAKEAKKRQSMKRNLTDSMSKV